MSGITDDAAVEVHDLLHRVETEELKSHPENEWAMVNEIRGQEDARRTSDATTDQEEKESKMDKIKNVLNLKK